MRKEEKHDAKKVMCKSKTGNTDHTLCECIKGEAWRGRLHNRQI